MSQYIVIDGPMLKDPDFIVGSCVTLERADGRSLWQQRLLVKEKRGDEYVLCPVDVTHGGRTKLLI